MLKLCTSKLWCYRYPFLIMAALKLDLFSSYWLHLSSDLVKFRRLLSFHAIFTFFTHCHNICNFVVSLWLPCICADACSKLYAITTCPWKFWRYFFSCVCEDLTLLLPFAIEALTLFYFLHYWISFSYWYIFGSFQNYKMVDISKGVASTHKKYTKKFFTENMTTHYSPPKNIQKNLF